MWDRLRSRTKERCLVVIKKERLSRMSECAVLRWLGQGGVFCWMPAGVTSGERVCVCGEPWAQAGTRMKGRAKREGTEVVGRKRKQRERVRERKTM